jgi:hypothetical protein
MRVPNPRRIKINFPYMVHEIAKACGVTRGTVRRWRKEGLKPIDDRKPYMFLGSEVHAFLEAKRRRNKNPCGPGEMYCVRCRRPTEPFKTLVSLQPRDTVVGTLIGICPDCSCSIYRHVSLQRLDVARANFDVR